MIAQRGTFIKTNGDEREMNFVRIENLPEGFIEKNTAGGTAPKLAEGQEIVWDLDASGFRVFNWNTAVGDVEEYTYENSNIFESGLNSTK
jgi:hypothetical protein